ncbi:MAG: hypothetical protein LC749_15790 [Actinobacteria bacterium]|nr:hypothetical protein [Actinomycetota bacterium]
MGTTEGQQGAALIAESNSQRHGVQYPAADSYTKYESQENYLTSDISPSSAVGSEVDVGDNVTIEAFVHVGGKHGSVFIGDDVVIRAGSIVYGAVTLGPRTMLGHHAVVREHCTIGAGCVIGTQVVLDGRVTVGDRSSIQTGAYVPAGTDIAEDVFIGPNAVLTNDKRMGSFVRGLRSRGEPFVGPHVRRGARIGANSTIMPEIQIGEDSVVGAGSVVTKDVPPRAIVMGVPAAVVGEVAQSERLRSMID